MIPPKLRWFFHLLLQKVFGLSLSSSRTRSLSRNATGIVFIHGFSFLSSFVVGFLLARWLGAEGYGIFTFVFSIVMVLGIFGSLGMKGLLVREVAVYTGQEKWKRLKGILRWSDRNVLIASMGLFVVGEGIVIGFNYPADPAINMALRMALLVLPFLCFTSLRSGALRGFHYTALGQVPEKVVRPILFIGGVSILYLFNWYWGVNGVIAANVVAFVVMFLVSQWLLSALKPARLQHETSTYQKRIWFQSGMTFFFITGMHVIEAKTDVIMIGSLAEAEDVGIYHIAKRLSDILTAFMAIINLVLAPTMSDLYSKGEVKQLQKYLTKSIRGVFFLTLPFGILLILLSPYILRIFGEEFVAGHYPLIILCFGQLFNMMAGSVGNILAMTGYEKSAAKGLGVGVIVNITLNAILIPFWGITGAAMATGISVVVWNSFLAHQVMTKTGLNPTVFARTGKKA